MPVKEEQFVDVAPFGIEADHPRNSDLLIQVIDCRLRSSIKPTKTIIDKGEDGGKEERPVNAWMVDGLPNHVPGMQLHVNPEKCTWVVIDPLEGDERTLEKIKKAVERATGYRVSDKLRAAPRKEGKLNKDQMKTLTREMVGIVKAKEAKIVKGILPDMEEVDELPGKYLLNSSNRNNWHQPKYEEDLPDFENRLHSMTQSGG